MKVIKKTVGMMLGALALLVALGFADPTNVRLMSSITEHLSNLLQAVGLVDARDVPDGEVIGPIIAEFNTKLSQAYRDLTPTALETVLMDEGLRRNYAEEIEFLRDDGRVLELTVGDIRIKQIIPMDELGLRVDTLETVKIRYLKAGDRREIQSEPDAVYAMTYQLKNTDSGWTIMDVETLRVGRRDD